MIYVAFIVVGTLLLIYLKKRPAHPQRDLVRIEHRLHQILNYKGT